MQKFFGGVIIFIGSVLIPMSGSALNCADGVRSTSAGLTLDAGGCYRSSDNKYYSVSSGPSGGGYTGPSTSGPSENILGIDSYRLRTGDITMADIPIIIASIIESLLALAGAVCVVALIYHAVRMQLASGITGDASGVDKAKTGIKGALMGFVLAMSAWFLMARLVALIASNT